MARNDREGTERSALRDRPVVEDLDRFELGAGRSRRRSPAGRPRSSADRQGRTSHWISKRTSGGPRGLGRKRNDASVSAGCWPISRRSSVLILDLSRRRPARRPKGPKSRPGSRELAGALGSNLRRRRKHFRRRLCCWRSGNPGRFAARSFDARASGPGSGLRRRRSGSGGARRRPVRCCPRRPTGPCGLVAGAAERGARIPAFPSPNSPCE